MAIRIDGTNTTANPGITGADADTGLQLGTDQIELVTGGTNRATVESNGDFTIEDGNLVFAAGHGIDFSATSDTPGMSSELLDDYEEGTWTPVLRGGTTAGTYTYDSQIGIYSKVGNIVHLTCNLNNIDTSSAGSGILQITGLPFAAKSGTGTAQGPMRLSHFNVVDSATTIQVSLNANSSTATLTETRDALAAASLSVTDRMNEFSDIYFSLTYFVA